MILPQLQLITDVTHTVLHQSYLTCLAVAELARDSRLTTDAALALTWNVLLLTGLPPFLTCKQNVTRNGFECRNTHMIGVRPKTHVDCVHPCLWYLASGVQQETWTDSDCW